MYKEDADTPGEKRVVVLVERGQTPARGRHMRDLVDDAPCERPVGVTKGGVLFCF